MRVALSQQQLDAGGQPGVARPEISRRAIGTGPGTVTLAGGGVEGWCSGRSYRLYGLK